MIIHGFPVVTRGYRHLPRWGKGRVGWGSGSQKRATMNEVGKARRVGDRRSEGTQPDAA